MPSFFILLWASFLHSFIMWVTLFSISNQMTCLHRYVLSSLPPYNLVLMLLLGAVITNKKKCSYFLFYSLPKCPWHFVSNDYFPSWPFFSFHFRVVYFIGYFSESPHGVRLPVLHFLSSIIIVFVWSLVCIMSRLLLGR